MKIGIVDADLMDNGTRHPNLALMKIAGYYIENGDQVRLIYESYDEIKNYDRVYISKVFSFTKVPDWVIRESNVTVGGTGFFEDGGESLPYKIEHHMPYYDLYKEYVSFMMSKGRNKNNYEDYLEYSIGFATRGCFRKCDFCVNKKYNKVQRHSSILEFYDGKRPKIYLWDDNILAYSKWEEVLDELELTGKPFQFRQGIDLRLMTDKKAYRFNNTRYHGDFIFAFDHLKDREIICSNIQLWKKYTNKSPKMYVLCGFESQDEKDIEDTFERIKLLMRYGCLPYIMRYEAYKESKHRGLYVQIARWCNQPQFYKKMSFREFCERNQYYHPNPNTICSAYRTMVEFEKEHKTIAEKYFDLKYMNENIYKVSYGYGQRYHNKPECKRCKIRKQNWDYLLRKKNLAYIILKLYIEKEINIRCLNYPNKECECTSYEVGEYIVNILINTSCKQIEDIILVSHNLEKIKSESILYSPIKTQEYLNFMDALFKKDINREFIVDEIYKEINVLKSHERVKINDIIKTLAMCDIIMYSRNNRKGIVGLTDIGKLIIALPTDRRKFIIKRLMYKIPLIQCFIRNNRDINKTCQYIEKSKDCKKVKNYLNEIWKTIHE